MEFLIITGLSGAGKSRAADVLEDLDYYCVDNMPIALMPRFAELCIATAGRYEKVALVTDVSASLERAERGGTLQPKELTRIAGILRCARTTRGYVSEDDEKTVLDSLFSALTPNKYLEDRIFGAILSEDEIADTASAALADIRRHMRIQSGKIRDSLQKVISSPAYSKFLREPIITIRQGRYVVPVKSECKNDVPGLVHDVSASGSTYFVEPMSAVNANNALRELELKEKKEIERILAELSAEAAGYREAINLDYQMLVQLDVIFAKAKLAYQMRAGAPIMNDQGRVELRKARHPLIDTKSVVPITVRLGTDFDTMIITGPNTGGKTVTLKTIGLLTLMAECGMHIPAGDGSVLSTFDAILADIGDEQSIAQSLSTRLHTLCDYRISSATLHHLGKCNTGNDRDYFNSSFLPCCHILCWASCGAYMTGSALWR